LKTKWFKIAKNLKNTYLIVYTFNRKTMARKFVKLYDICGKWDRRLIEEKEDGNLREKIPAQEVRVMKWELSELLITKTKVSTN